MPCAFFQHKKCIFWVTDKPVIRRKLVQYRNILLVPNFFAYFPRLKARKILCKKISELVKYFLYCTRNCLISITYPYQSHLIEACKRRNIVQYIDMYYFWFILRLKCVWTANFFYTVQIKTDLICNSYQTVASTIQEIFYEFRDFFA